LRLECATIPSSCRSDVRRQAGIRRRHEGRSRLARGATVPPIGEAEPVTLPLIPELLRLQTKELIPGLAGLQCAVNAISWSKEVGQ
jgi:hypothetical protein